MRSFFSGFSRLPTPSVDDIFSDEDREIILRSLDTAKQLARPYEGSYKAAWLLSEFTDLVWITTNHGREEKVNGTWKNVVVVNWDVVLPNGERLSDPKFSKLLDLNRRIAYLVRSGFVNGEYAVKPWRAVVAVLLQLTSWLVLHEELFRPSEYGFKLLEQEDINVLLSSFSEGGWVVARKVPERLLAYLYVRVFGKACPDELNETLYDLPISLREEIVKWLEDNKFYSKPVSGPNSGKRYLKRGLLAEILGESVSVISSGSLKFSVFCRQFEPDLNDGPLLLKIHQKTEFPSQKVRPIRAPIEPSSESALHSVCTNLNVIFATHRHSPDLLPDPCIVSVREAENSVLKSTKLGSHHSFIPMDVGFNYLNEAFRFVHVYGESIVDYYLAMGPTRPKGRFDKNVEMLNKKCNKLAKRFVIKDRGDVKPIAEALGIKDFQIMSVIDFDLFRKQPTLTQMLRVLIGACIICIAMMKPSRADELKHLKRNCLHHNSDGYHLNFSLGKRNVGATHLESCMPIPVIAAKAVKLLQKLGSALVELFNEKRKIANNLFYLPKLHGQGAKKADTYLLNMHIDIFCDYVALDPDGLGRRWYVRIHEMRKWFLLLLFWSGRFDVLDAARWIAGHANINHIYAYIEREFPGEELPALEAEYAIERLRVLESCKGQGCEVEHGLHELYEIVLSHFNIASLSMISEFEWIDYISTLRNDGGFLLEPHSVFDDDNEVVGVNVSFVLRETTR